MQPTVELIVLVKLDQVPPENEIQEVSLTKEPVQLSNEKIYPDRESVQFNECKTEVPARVEFVEFKE